MKNKLLLLLTTAIAVLALVCYKQHEEIEVLYGCCDDQEELIEHMKKEAD